MTPVDMITDCLLTIKAIRDTIEAALIGKVVTCKAAGKLEGHECQVIGVHVDCYTGVALQLVSMEGNTIDFTKNNAVWVHATETELPPMPWDTRRYRK